MIIQPFVENAIWHGILPSHHPGKVAIKVRERDNMIVIIVEDNGVGYNHSPRKKNHISKGMSIVRERLTSMMHYISPDKLIEIIDLSDINPQTTGTRIIITLEKKIQL